MEVVEDTDTSSKISACEQLKEKVKKNNLDSTTVVSYLLYNQVIGLTLLQVISRSHSHSFQIGIAESRSDFESENGACSNDVRNLT